MRRALLFLTVLQFGCKAEMVEVRKPVKGPVPEVGMIDPGGGHVRYALKGGDFLVKHRRESAFKRMAKQCGGSQLVRIEKEYTQDDSETPYHGPELDPDVVSESSPHYKVETYHHIEFRCVAK